MAASRKSKTARRVEPTLDDYLKSAMDLAATVRRAFDHPHSVSRSELKKALEKFERMDKEATP